MVALKLAGIDAAERAIEDLLRRRRGADLRRADLRGANLRGADLWGANLRDADAVIGARPRRTWAAAIESASSDDSFLRL